jgi:hypothetical protein
MIPPPHGFAPAEDSIGNEKNITFLGREMAVRYAKAGRPHVRFGSKACAAQKGMSALLPKADTLPRYHPLVLSDGALQPLVLSDGGANVLGN